MFWNKNKKQEGTNNLSGNTAQPFNPQGYKNPAETEKELFDDLKIPSPEEFGLSSETSSTNASMPAMPAAPIMPEEKKKGVLGGLFAKKEKSPTNPGMPQMPPLPELEMPNFSNPSKTGNDIKNNMSFPDETNNSSPEMLGNIEIPSPDTISAVPSTQSKAPQPITSSDKKTAAPESKPVADKKSKKQKDKGQPSDADIKEAEVKAEIKSEQVMDKKINSSNIRKDKLLKDMLDDLENELLKDRKDIEESSKKLLLIEKELGTSDLRKIATKKSSKKTNAKKTVKKSLKNKKPKKKTSKSSSKKKAKSKKR